MNNSSGLAADVWMKGVNVGASVFLILAFVVGIAGNVWVIALTSNIAKRRLDGKTCGGSSGGTQMLAYVGALSVVDSLALLTVPFTVTTGLSQQWHFGPAACRIAFGVEGINKVLTTFIMVGLAADRYLAVCHAHRFERLRTVKAALVFICVSALLATCLLAPAVLFTQLNQGKYCITGWPSAEWRSSFIIIIFVMGFCVPGFIIAFCYLQILTMLSRHARNLANSQISLRTVTKSSLMIVAFYFSCWTPFWVYQITMMLLSHGGQGSFRTTFMVGRVMTVLPMLNAALNWIFYAFLNRALRRTPPAPNTPDHTLQTLLDNTASPGPHHKETHRLNGS